MADPILTAIGDVAALAAALFAFLALREARDTVKQAKDAQLEAARNRMRDRIEHVAEIIEAMASAAKDTPRRRGVHHNRLGFALAGLHQELPQCAALFNDVKTVDEFERYNVGDARKEIDRELNTLSKELAQPTL